MAARFARQKDHPTLLRAVALLRESGHRPPVLLAGGGNAKHRAAAERLCTELGLNDQVRFLGQVPDVPLLLKQSCLCVLSSHHEGMPLALVEGMAAGCAVVGSAVPGIRELLRDGVDGRLVPAADPPALAAVLRELLEDPARAERMGQAARSRVLAEFTLDQMVGHYSRLLLSLRSAACRAG